MKRGWPHFISIYGSLVNRNSSASIRGETILTP